MSSTDTELVPVAQDLGDRLVGQRVRLDRDQRGRLGLDREHVPVAADDELLAGLVGHREALAVEVVVDRRPPRGSGRRCSGTASYWRNSFSPSGSFERTPLPGQPALLVGALERRLRDRSRPGRWPGPRSRTVCSPRLAGTHAGPRGPAGASRSSRQARPCRARPIGSLPRQLEGLQDVLREPLHDERLVDEMTRREAVLEEVARVAVGEPGLRAPTPWRRPDARASACCSVAPSSGVGLLGEAAGLVVVQRPALPRERREVACVPGQEALVPVGAEAGRRVVQVVDLGGVVGDVAERVVDQVAVSGSTPAAPFIRVIRFRSMVRCRRTPAGRRWSARWSGASAAGPGSAPWPASCRWSRGPAGSRRWPTAHPG